VKVGDLVMCNLNWSPKRIGTNPHRIGVVVEASLDGALRVMIDGEVNHLWKYEVEVISESR